MPQGRRVPAMATVRSRPCSSVTLQAFGINAPPAPDLRGAHVGAISSRIAIGVRRAVAALEAHLVWPVRRRPVHKELGIEGDAAFRIGVELDHPSCNAVGIEL